MSSKARRPRTKKRGSSAIKTALFIIISMILVVIIFAVGFVLKSVLVKPNVSDGEDTFYTGSEDVNGGNDTSKGLSNDTEETNPNPGLTRKKDFYTFMLVGKDKVGLNTDVIMIASFDVANGAISIMQIPRDTYFRGVDGVGRKINTTLGKLYDSHSASPMKDAMQSMAKCFERNLNIKIDYYALVDLAGFESIVNRIGGVTVDVPIDMNYEDPDQGFYIHLKKGVQNLNGEQAEQFIRFRMGWALADIGRMDAQKIFMSAFLKKLKTSINLSTVTGLATDCFTYVTTDMELDECIYFAKQVLSIDMSNIHMLSMQGDGYNGGIYYIMYRDTMLEAVNKYFNVYTTDIPSEYFDVDGVFTNNSNSGINNIYTTSGKSINDKTADEISENGLTIPVNPDYSGK